ncbi:uncharacterized protein TRAVEDRAFT_50602 [Trametes versicolor FP-101664 SS1]|uniref:uncharacterized protein n=1 Tax=Trametes versicolor (strain FP-101664) TaxID=717944 RepID=UPI0004624408|nr:uncharacterized protein TRAVEDRAFT_50602 [Trametes versicolor FP-101664 SS1]EIW56114.1 hypothetical protein TRAVEDRAFT_50602 [Trametes versicolor FP-101664 SS1]
MDTLPDSGSCMRRIRNIDFCSQELETLLPNRVHKISGTTLDAFAAVAQEVADASSKGRNFAFFSSWIPAIVSGRERDGGHAGSIEEHLLAACKDQDRADARSRPRWAIPLCGGDPAHWVLGWVDYSSKECGVVDSIPELESASEWAKPLLHASIDRLRESLGMPNMDWSTMSMSVRSPAPHEQQMDSWSCGLFVMIAMQTFADNWEHPLLGDSAKEAVRAGALRALLNVPPRPSRIRPPHAKIPQAEAEAMAVDETKLPEVVARPIGSAASAQALRGSNSAGSLSDNSARDAGSTSGKKRALTEVVSDEEDAAPPAAKFQKVSTEPEAQGSHRRARKTAAQRQLVLTKDPWTREVEAHRVQCTGCRQWVVLNKKRQFDGANWESHKKHCSHITGMKTVRHAEIEGGKVTWNKRTVAATPSIARIFQTIPGPHYPAAGVDPKGDTRKPRVKTPEPQPAPCQHLRDGVYTEYVLRTQTRSLGGISPSWRGRIARQLFRYKPFPPLRSEQGPEAASGSTAPRPSVPSDGNAECEEKKWTLREQLDLDHALGGWARWTVDYGRQLVKSTRCEGTTMNESGVCDACQTLGEKDAGLKRSITRKNKESELPEEEQRHMSVQRDKYAPLTVFKSTEARDLRLKMADPVIFPLVQLLERGDVAGALLSLYQRAKEGGLAKYQSFIDICAVLDEQLARAESDSPGAKKGIRYTQDYLNFMTMMRSYGQQSGQQYSILTSQIGGPSPRTLQKVIKRSPDVLTKPDLDFENVARVKRLMDILKYNGPVAVAGDCTKVRQRLTYSNDHGSHVLGSTLPFEQCAVADTEEISRLVKRIGEEKQYASQVRAILIKIPLPHIPPMVIALRPTKGNDDAMGIHALHLQLLEMARQLGIKVVSLSADGASSEQGAQSLMDHSQTTHAPIAYEYKHYGIELRAPVLATGPLISCQDPQHARKTSRNQPQHGTHTASLGRGVMVNRTLVSLQETGTSGLVRRDIENVDKQDDGAARRLFHPTALQAMTKTDEKGTLCVHDEFRGLFVYLFILGELFDAWLNRRLAAHERVLAALRARLFLNIWHHHIKSMERRFPDLYKPHRAFISPASFNIFNRLCDTLILLILAYDRFYPDQPFCPWLLGTEFVEHFFGLARTLLPNFTYAELLKLVKHVMLRQTILLSGKVSAKKERTSRVGYALDYDPSPLTPEELKNARVRMPKAVLDKLVELAYKEAAQIAKQLLRMPVPVLPLKHIPLRAPNPSSRRRAPKNTVQEDEEDTADEEDLADGDSDSLADDAELGEDSDESDDEDGSGEDAASGPIACIAVTGSTAAPLAQAADTSSGLGDSGLAALAEQTADAAGYTARYAALSEDFDAAIQEVSAASDPTLSTLCEATSPLPIVTAVPKPFIGPLPPPIPPSPSTPSELMDALSPKLGSRILDDNNKVVVQSMLDIRVKNQSSTRTRSERVVMLDPKFALSRLSKPNEKMSMREGSHHVRVLQDLASSAVKPVKTAREQRWNETARQVQLILREEDLPNLHSKNVTSINPLRPGALLIMKNEARTYLGEVLDIYKKSNRRHGSLDMASSTSGLSYLSLRVYLQHLPAELALHSTPNDDEDAELPSDDEDEDFENSIPPFSCRSGTVDIHTHAPADHLLYNLGTLASSGPPHLLTLKPFAVARWRALTQKKVQEKLIIRIPAKVNMAAAAAAAAATSPSI